MTDREKELRFNLKWNRVAMYLGLVLAFFNALIHNPFFIVCFGLAALNGWCYKRMEQCLKDEGYEDEL
jgi:hypothetical protein